jgi:outer membrane protein
MRISLTMILLTLLTAHVGADETNAVRGASALPELPLSLSLPEAVALALEHSPRLKQNEEVLFQQDQSVRENRAARLPRLNATGGIVQYDQGRLQSFGGGGSVEDTYWSAAAEASITVFSGGRNHNAVKREKSRYAAFESDLVTVRELLLAAVHETYYNAELAQLTIKVQEESTAVLNEQLTFSSNRLKAGVGDKFDVVQAKVALANSEPPLIRAKNNYRRQIESLRRLLGMQYPAGKDARDIDLQASAALEATELNVESAALRAVEGRPELQQLDALIRAEQLDLKVLHREHVPVVDLFANYGMEGNQFGAGNLEGYTAGVRINWLLWNGGRSTSQSRKSASRIRQLEHQKTELVLQISGEVREAFYAYEEAASILASSAEALEQAAEALRLSRNRIEAGSGTQLEVLESQYQLTQSKLENSRARNGLQRATIGIQRASGIPIQ